MNGRRLRRAGQIVAVAVLLAALVLIAWFCGFALAYEACDQHGGVEADSPAGRLCESPLGNAWFALGVLGPPVIAIAAGVTLLRRRDIRWALWGAAVAVALFVGFGAVATRLSTECSPADQRAYDAWGRDGSDGLPPADCESY